MKAREIKTVVYLISGQGADHRLFANLKLDGEYATKHIKYVLPNQKMTMKEYAKELSNQIDISTQFMLIGVSLGGMLATEMSEFLNPQKVILISSAKSRRELPRRYTFQKDVPLYKILSGGMAKRGAQIMQPIVEPVQKQYKEIFKSMLNDKDPEFLKRTIGMIINWERVCYSNEIIHIHGDKDNTIPIRNVKYDYLIENGSHMMVLTKGEEISKLINKILKTDEQLEG